MKKKLCLLGLVLLQSFNMVAQEKQSPILVPLEGAINFRDIGGYTTTSGKKILTNKIYRSAEISTLTDHDLKELKNKHISTVIDFRGTKEAKAAPDRLPEGAHYFLCPAGSEDVDNSNYDAFLEKIKNNDQSFMTDFYGKEGIKYFGDRYRLLFQKLLATPNTESILYHCTAGRDRTGMATALLYYILEVPMETIIQDYLASNEFLKQKKKSGKDDSDKSFKAMIEKTGLDKETLEDRIALKPEYLNLFFTTIQNKYGSVENFLKEEMGISSHDITKLRQKFTN